MDQSNATFDNTLNSTLETTEIGTNSTKVDETTADDDNDDGDAESDTKDEPVDTTVNDNDNENDIVTESTDINSTTNMVNNSHQPIAIDFIYVAFIKLWILKWTDFQENNESVADGEVAIAAAIADVSEPTSSEPDVQSTKFIEKNPEKALIEKVIEKAEAVSTTVGDNVHTDTKTDMKTDDKKLSRSGRIIKNPKYVTICKVSVVRIKIKI